MATPFPFLALAGAVALFLVAAVDFALQSLRIRSLLAYAAGGAFGGWLIVAALSVVAEPVEIVTGAEDIPFNTSIFGGALLCVIYWLVVRRRSNSGNR